MKNKDLAIACIVILTFVFGVLLYIKLPKNSNSYYYVFMGDYNKDINKDGYYLYTNYVSFYNKFKSNELTERDFDNYNYLVVSIGFDACSEQNLKLEKYDVDNNTINVYFTYTVACDYCDIYYNYYLLRVDKSIKNPIVNINYEPLNKLMCGHEMPVDKKPLIYLYPEAITNVEIQLGKPENLTTTYPLYKDKWVVTAYPDGTLIDQNGREYYCLYWEGKNDVDIKYNDGFIVEKNELIPFLEEKLSILGLNDREANEFIIYWLPILEKNNYNMIRFENIDTINKMMSIDINPKPDTIIRILMEYKGIDRKINIKEQELTTPLRQGFTAIEWGGMELKD